MDQADASEIWDLSPVPTLIVSPSHRIQRVSNGLLRVWNSQRGDFVGKDLFAALYGSSPLERFERIPLTHAIEVAVAARDVKVCHAVHRTGNLSWSARIIPVFREDDLLSVVLEWDKVEISARPTGGELTQSMLSVDETLRLLIDAVKDYAIFLLDTRGYVATWNIGAELLKGFKREDIVGNHFSTFYGQDDLAAGKPERELAACLREGRVQDEGWRYRKDGSRFWALVVITAVYKNGVHVGFGKVTRDLTERREGELRITAAYQESSQLKNDFLANMSHEIRTPMHGMLSACDLLLDTPLTEDQREMANIVAESGEVLLQVINGILDYSKLASGNFTVSLDMVSVAGLVSSVVRNVQVRLLPAVHIKLDLAPDVPKAALGDALRFRQIVQNIVDNAAKFTEQGWIRVNVMVTGEDEAGYTILTEVADTGLGVPDTAVQSLFSPFTQLEKSTKKRFQGTGLGLSIAKSLAELMGGQMGYRPNPDHHGSIFWCSIKLKKIAVLESSIPLGIDLKSEGRPDSHQAPSSESKGRSDSHQASINMNTGAEALRRLRQIATEKKILMAEDNIINQRVLVEILHSFGLKDVAVASDGAQAVSMLKSSPDAYDLVLMDVSMPIMDGFEATAMIRNSGMQIPIIAMTAHALKGDMEVCLAKGMDDYISKPVNKKLLLQQLLKWLGQEAEPASQEMDGIE